MASSLCIVPIFLIASAYLFFLTYLAPRAPDSGQNVLKFPTSYEDVSMLSKVFKSYRQSHRAYVLCLFTSAYVYKQAFSIPGSALLNILGGAIFGLWLALPLCCILTAIGATLAYTLSKLFAKDFVSNRWPNEVGKLRTKIESHRDELFFYLLSLRLMPLTPNWLLNLISPIVSIPLHLFFITVFLGLIPYNYVCIQSGAMLADISSLDDVFTWKLMMQLAVLAFAVFLLPKVIKRISASP